jgi:hypothetical protein
MDQVLTLYYKKLSSYTTKTKLLTVEAFTKKTRRLLDGASESNKPCTTTNSKALFMSALLQLYEMFLLLFIKAESAVYKCMPSFLIATL